MSYILNTKEDIKEMLKIIGKNSLEDLFSHLPKEIILNKPLNLGDGLSEQEVKEKIKKLSLKNKPISEYNSFLGGGLYDHYIPSAVKYLSSLPEFTTAYTPYQAECSQGILQAIYEYQSYICLLTGLDVSSASLLDGASSFAEAVLMALRINKRNEIIISSLIHPEYERTLRTYLSGFNFKIKKVGFTESGNLNLKELENLINKDTSLIAFQSPNFLGYIEDVENIVHLAKSIGALSVMITNPLSLVILKEPAKFGVDIACGEGGFLGGDLNFGGSCFGFLATKNEYVRQIPGRLVGRTTDLDGNISFCLTLQTREQHIRREKATSNICSNSSFNAIRAAIYLSLLGKDGLYKVALYSLNLAHYLYKRLKEIKYISFPFGGYFFNEFTYRIKDSKKFFRKLYKKKIIPGLLLDKFNFGDCILISCTEKKTKEDIDNFISTIKEIYG